MAEGGELPVWAGEKQQGENESREQVHGSEYITPRAAQSLLQVQGETVQATVGDGVTWMMANEQESKSQTMQQEPPKLKPEEATVTPRIQRETSKPLGKEGNVVREALQKGMIKPTVGEPTVVREIDLFISRELSDLTLLQFPLKQTYVPPLEFTEAKYKPQADLLAMEFPFDEETQRMAELETGKPSFKSQPLRSISIEQRASVCVGVIRSGNMYLTPLRRVLQMRPTFTQVRTAEEEYDVPDEGKPDLPKVEHVQMRKIESDKAIAARMNTFAYRKTVVESEPWTNLRVAPSNSEDALNAYEKMCTTVETQIPFIQEDIQGIFRDATPIETEKPKRK